MNIHGVRGLPIANQSRDRISGLRNHLIEINTRQSRVRYEFQSDVIRIGTKDDNEVFNFRSSRGAFSLANPCMGTNAI